MKGEIFIFVTLLLGLSAAQLNCGGIAHGSITSDVHSCSKFFICSNGTLVSTTCPEDYGFNPVAGKCEFNPTCWKNEGGGSVIPPSATNPCSGRDDGTFLPSPLSCRFFYYCFSNVSILKSCPEGYVYSNLESVCVPQRSECPYP